MGATRVNTALLVVALMSAEILGVFEVTMLYAAMRYLLADFGGPVIVGWFFAAFGLASAVCAALGSRLGDIFGRRRVLLIAIATGICGSLLAGFSTEATGVIAGRVLQGSSGAILPLCIGLARENVSADKVKLVIGTLSATVTVSAGGALLLGGVIVDNLSWHWIFYAGAAAGLVAWTLVVSVVPPSRPAVIAKSESRQGRVNYLGGLLFAPGIASALAAITLSKSWGWDSPGIWFLMLLGLFLLIAWIRSELRADVPLIDVRLLKKRQIALANLIFALVALTAMQQNQIISLLVQQPTWTSIGLGVSATMTGLVLLPGSLIAFLGGPGAGWAANRIGTKNAMLIGAVFLIVGWGGIYFSHGSLLAVVAWVVIQGLGMSIVYSVVPMLIITAVPIARTSEAIGIPTVVRSAFMGIGAQAVGFLLALSFVTNESGAQFPDETAFQTTLLYVLGGSVLVFIAARFLPSASSSLKEVSTGLRT